MLKIALEVLFVKMKFHCIIALDYDSALENYLSALNSYVALSSKVTLYCIKQHLT